VARLLSHRERLAERHSAFVSDVLSCRTAGHASCFSLSPMSPREHWSLRVASLVLLAGALIWPHSRQALRHRSADSASAHLAVVTSARMARSERPRPRAARDVDVDTSGDATKAATDEAKTN
jgi:hypothetical protein